MELTARKLTVGQVLDEWFAVVRRHWPSVLIAYGLLALVTAAVDIGLSEVFTASAGPETLFGSGGMGALVFNAIAGIVIYYLVLERVMIAEGLMRSGQPRRIGAFFGASILAGLGIVAGLILLIAPGFILMARWAIMAPCIAANDLSASDGMRQSWDATAQCQGSLAAVMVIQVVAQLGLGVLLGILTGAFSDAEALPGLSPDYALRITGEQLISNLGVGLALLLVVAIYRLIAGSQRELDAVFA
jgi:hypothetical protein